MHTERRTQTSIGESGENPLDGPIGVGFSESADGALSSRQSLHGRGARLSQIDALALLAAKEARVLTTSVKFGDFEEFGFDDCHHFRRASTNIPE